MSDDATPKPAEPIKPVELPAHPVVSEHETTLTNGERIRYRATCGTLPIRNTETGATEADIFYMAYTVVTDEPRPLLFSFNGGPGSASVWLHLGAVGPKRIPMAGEKGDLPVPPYSVVDNPDTWLAHADLVFIDPVGTGYSRPATTELGKKFWNVQGDIESLSEFIRLYLSRYDRWASPCYLVGESYGTTRGAGIAAYLLEHGIALSGIILVSAVTQFQTLEFESGNDLPYPLFLPTYAATAFYHGKLSPEVGSTLAEVLTKAESFAEGEYAAALQKGDRLTGDERARVLSELSRLIGVSETFLDDCDLRPQIFPFCKELLRRERKTVGRLDSRLTGYDTANDVRDPEHDPSLTAITPPYTSAFNHYIRTALGYRTDAVYHILGTGITTPWDWQAPNKYVETASRLSAAMAQNPHLRVFVASGYFDLATPYFATEYTLSHQKLHPAVRQNIITRYYEAGHMMYIHAASLQKLKNDVAAFLAG